MAIRFAALPGTGETTLKSVSARYFPSRVITSPQPS